MIFTITNNAFSQLKLTVKLNKSLDSSKLKIFYSDGEVKKFIAPKFTNNALVLSETIKSKYARIILMYPDKFGHLPGQVFLISKKISYLQFDEVADSITDRLSNYKSKNLIDVKKSKLYNQLNWYTKKELNDHKLISDICNVTPTDSNLKLRNRAYEKLALKELEYIKLHGNNYIYFEKFIQDIVPSIKENHLLELYEFFNNNFPLNFKEMYEGKYVKTLLEGNLYVKIGMQSPQFKTLNNLGIEISSEKLKGKYYILSFWATWCGPCLEKIPQLKNIRAKYDENKLAIISISCEKDSIKFKNAIEKYKMNWIHIFNKPEIRNLFGDKPIPSLYLIDKNGKIIFSSWEKNMSELDVILKNELK